MLLHGFFTKPLGHTGMSQANRVAGDFCTIHPTPTVKPFENPCGFSFALFSFRFCPHTRCTCQCSEEHVMFNCLTWMLDVGRFPIKWTSCAAKTFSFSLE